MASTSVKEQPAGESRSTQLKRLAEATLTPTFSVAIVLVVSTSDHWPDSLKSMLPAHSATVLAVALVAVAGLASIALRKKLLRKAPTPEVVAERDVEALLLALRTRAKEGFERNRERGLKLASLRTKELPFFGTVEWQLQPGINVLLGRNGYGKSHLLRLVAALLARETEALQDYFGGGPGQVELELVDPNDDAAELTIGRTSSRWIDEVSKVPVLAIGDTRVVDRSHKTIERPVLTDDEKMPQGGAYHFVHQRPLVNLIEHNLFLLCLDDVEARIGRRGLRDFVGRVVAELTGPEQFEITKILRANRAELKFEILVNTEGSGGPVPLQEASQGTLSVLAIILHIHFYLAALYPKIQDNDALAKQPGIVIIDEIDAHLHPAWQQRIVWTLRRSFPNVQFVVSAHSPLVVAGCRGGEVSTLRRQSKAFELHRFEHDFIGWDPAEILRKVQEVDPSDVEYLRLKAAAIDKRKIEEEVRLLEDRRDLTAAQKEHRDSLKVELLDIAQAERRAANRLDRNELENRVQRLERELRDLRGHDGPR